MCPRDSTPHPPTPLPAATQSRLTHPVRIPYEHAIVRAPAHSLDEKFPTLQSPHSHAIHCWLASELLPKHSLQSAVQSTHTRAYCSCRHNSHAIHLPTCVVLIPTPHLTFFPRARACTHNMHSADTQACAGPDATDRDTGDLMGEQYFLVRAIAAPLECVPNPPHRSECGNHRCVQSCETHRPCPTLALGGLPCLFLL